MKISKRLVLFFALALLAACSGGGDEGKPAQSGGDHVWKEQTATIEKAKEAEQIIQNAADLERKQIEKQSQ